MTWDVDFLARLGLDNTAAAQDIRRAYARELKLVDPEKDLARFQSLREAYEAAMRWTEAPGEPGPEPAAGPGPSAGAVAAWGRFEAAFGARAHTDDDTGRVALEALLRATLEDDELFSIAARDTFEASVAQLLAGGWRPGHAALLVAASTVFGWADDAGRLFRLGYAGAVISQALDERNMFDSQPDADVLTQRKLVIGLRQLADPQEPALIEGVPHLDALAMRFPTWLPLVTDVGNIERWKALHNRIPLWKRVVEFQKEESRLDKPGSVAWSVIAGIFFWMWLLSEFAW